MISVIVPVYNVAPYIDRCVRSVIAQVEHDWECILVNDGSTDESGSICDKWAASDSRIKVIHQHNQGVSVARNNGIEASTGAYVAFIDSDDWVEPTYLSDLKAHLHDADLVVSGLFRENGQGPVHEVCPPSTETFELNPAGAHYFTLLNQRYLLYAPYNKLYKAAVIKQHHVSFPVGCSYGEDLMFNFQYLEHVQRISMVSKPSYHYMEAFSVLSKKLRIDQFDNDYKQWVVRKDFFVKKGMFTEEARGVMYKFLWGIVYDGIFLFPKLVEAPKQYLDTVLGIQDIPSLKFYAQVFSCAPWIKWAILHRRSTLFYLYFKVQMLAHVERGKMIR